MATRVMIDGTNSDAQAIKREFGMPQMLAYYVTGSQGIPWTAADIAMFPDSIHVTIDQGGSGSPVTTAIVRDVEPGAWGADVAVRHAPWTPDRPTIYCDRNDLPAVIAAGWRKDVWLAWPGYAGSGPPTFAGVNIVAVQNVFGTDHDSSIVYDTTWPHTPAPRPPASVMSATITGRMADISFGLAIGADHYVIEYTPDGSTTGQLVTRLPQPKSGAVVHGLNLEVPGARGGHLTAFAIIHGAANLIGSVTLP